MSKIRTLKADIPPASAGTILPHEHVLINMLRDYRSAGGLLIDVETMTSEVAAFAAAGGGTIVDLTVGELAAGTVGQRGYGDAADLEPDPGTYSRPAANVRALHEISNRTGIHIVVGTGHYRDPYLDKDWFDRHSVDRIAEYLIRDIEEGFADTGLRAGVIGEIGSDRWYVSAAEERSFRAAARAHHRTGATITTHSNHWASQVDAQLALLHEEDVPPEKIIIGHVDLVADADHAMEMARRGVYVQFDYFADCVQGGVVNRQSLKQRVNSVLKLIRAGYRDQILVSHDVALESSLQINGGTGFTFLLEAGKEAFLEAGLTEEDFDHITRTNSQRALSF